MQAGLQMLILKELLSVKLYAVRFVRYVRRTRHLSCKNTVGKAITPAETLALQNKNRNIIQKES